MQRRKQEEKHVIVGNEDMVDDKARLSKLYNQIRNFVIKFNWKMRKK